MNSVVIVTCQVDPSRTLTLHLLLGFHRDDCEFGGQLNEATQGSVLSCTDSDSEVGPADPQNSTTDTPVLEAAAPSVVPLGGADTPTSPLEADDAPSSSKQELPKPFIPASDSFINSLVSDRDKTSSSQPTITEFPQEEVEEKAPATLLPSPEPVGHDVPWMNVDLEGAEAGRNAQRAGPAVTEGGAAAAAATYSLETLETFQGVGEEDGPAWTWISGGGCDVDTSSQISWLSPTGVFTIVGFLVVLLDFSVISMFYSTCLFLSVVSCVDIHVLRVCPSVSVSTSVRLSERLTGMSVCQVFSPALCR